MNQLMQSILSTNALLSHFSICFTNILLTTEFESVVLVYTNKSADLADDLHKSIASQTNYTWKVYNSNIQTTLRHHNSTKYFYEKSFFIYVLDSFEIPEYNTIYLHFLAMTRYDIAAKALFVVHKKPSIYKINIFIKNSCFVGQNINYAFIFWKDPITFYICSGYDEQILLLHFENLTCPNDIAERLYYDKTVNMYGANLNVITVTNPPRIVRTVGRNDNGEIIKSIGGLDVMISDVIAQHLNFTFKYHMFLNVTRLVGSKVSANVLTNNGYTDVMRLPDSIEEQPFNVSKIHKYSIVDNLTVDIIESMFINRTFDIEVNSPDYSNYLMSLKQSGPFYLYPHDTEVYIIIVPKQLKSQLQLENLFKSPLFSVWGVLIVTISTIRLCLARLTKSVVRVSDVFLDTFGLSLGISTDIKIGNVSEKILMWFFCLSTMLSCMILSTYLFQGFALNSEVPTINSLDDLRKSKYPIRAPTYIYSVEAFFREANITTIIANYEGTITSKVLHENTRVAYVMRKSKFDTIIKNKNIWHIAHQFGEEYMSYKLWYYLSLVNRFNEIIQRLVEHGIIIHLKEKNKLILKIEGQHVGKLITNTVSAVSLREIQDTFLILIVGLMLALFLILVEFAVAKYQTAKLPTFEFVN